MQKSYFEAFRENLVLQNFWTIWYKTLLGTDKLKLFRKFSQPFKQLLAYRDGQ